MRSIRRRHDERTPDTGEADGGGSDLLEGERSRTRLPVTGVAIGALAVATLVMAACSGSPDAANHQTCQVVRQALTHYNQKNYPAWKADLTQAAQVAQGASDTKLRSLAQHASSLANAPTTTTPVVPAGAKPGSRGISLNLHLENVGAFAQLKSYCQSSYPS